MSKTILLILLGGLFLQVGCGSKNSPTTPGSSSPTYNYPFQFNFGDGGTGNGQFTLAAGIAVFRNALFVVDAAGSGRVEKFDLSGNFLSAWPGTPAFGQPFGIAVDKNGVVYVTDRANNLIEKFDDNGNSLGSFGASGTGVGQFNAPWAIAVDSAAASVYISEEFNNRFQRCTTSGTGCVTVGGTASGTGNGQFYTPTGIALDASGNIYVADINNSRIQVFNSGLAFVRKFGSSGSGNGQFGTTTYGIGGLAVDPNGNLLVVDTDNLRVEKFTPGGGFLQSIGAPTGGWSLPRMVATDPSNNVYVGDETGDFVSKFAPN